MADFWRTGPIRYRPIANIATDPENTTFIVTEDDVLCLPPGVHLLSQESQDIMQRIAERSAALEAGFTKRGS